MPWGHECRSKLIKQRTLKPTKRVHPISQETDSPGPGYYEQPKIYGGPGFSHIRRAPAYSFGIVTKTTFSQSGASPTLFDIRNFSAKGTHRIPGGIITPHIDPPYDKFKVPGPGAYAPRTRAQTRRPPAYSIRCVPKKPHRVIVEWTPPPNMYCPPIPKKSPPAYSFGYPKRILTAPTMPGPGEHNPNYDIIRKNRPAYSFGTYIPPPSAPKTPPPNIYCEKLFMVNKPSIPAPSFGIRHSPYLGKRTEFLKTPELDQQISQV